MTAGGTHSGCTKGLCVQTAPLDTLKRKKTVPILDSLPRMAGLGGQQGCGGATRHGTSLCPAAASPALPTHQHTHLWSQALVPMCWGVCAQGNTGGCPCEELKLGHWLKGSPKANSCIWKN